MHSLTGMFKGSRPQISEQLFLKPWSSFSRKKKSYKTVKRFFKKTLNFKTCDLVHISNIDVWGLLTKPVGPYVDPSIKFCLPVFTNFSSCLFAIVNRNYDECLTWKKFRADLISWSAKILDLAYIRFRSWRFGGGLRKFKKIYFHL